MTLLTGPEIRQTKHIKNRFIDIMSFSTREDWERFVGDLLREDLPLKNNNEEMEWLESLFDATNSAAGNGVPDGDDDDDAGYDSPSKNQALRPSAMQLGSRSQMTTTKTKTASSGLRRDVKRRLFGDDPEDSALTDGRCSAKKVAMTTPLQMPKTPSPMRPMTHWVDVDVFGGEKDLTRRLRRCVDMLGELSAMKFVHLKGACVYTACALSGQYNSNFVASTRRSTGNAAASIERHFRRRGVAGGNRRRLGSEHARIRQNHHFEDETIRPSYSSLS